MSDSQIHDVNVVAHAGAVRGCVVIPEHVQMRAEADCHLRHEGHEVVRRALRIFTDQSARVRADRIEVAENPDAPRGIASLQIPQHLFHGQFRVSVGIGGGERMIFCQRQPLRIAIDRGGGTEHQRLDPTDSHRLQQTQRTDDIVVIVGRGAAGLIRRPPSDRQNESPIARRFLAAPSPAPLGRGCRRG